MTQLNISGAWRTRKQALSHILSELVGGRLGAMAAPKGEPWNTGCAYEAVKDGVVTHCGVGCLFNDAQIRSIKARGLNSEDVWGLRDNLGQDNLETVTGLCMDELDELQSLHDMEWHTIQESPKSSSLYFHLKGALLRA